MIDEVTGALKKKFTDVELFHDGNVMHVTINDIFIPISVNADLMLHENPVEHIAMIYERERLAMEEDI